MSSAIELTGLHERISLRALMFFGSNPKWSLILLVYYSFIWSRAITRKIDFQDTFGSHDNYGIFELMDYEYSYLFHDASDCELIKLFKKHQDKFN